jgi:Alcohol dehydrogenase GroES-like domain
MRAMVLMQQKRVEELPLTQREMDAPRAGPGEVRVKVSVCAVCRTDLHIIEGDLAPHKMPVIPGHLDYGRHLYQERELLSVRNSSYRSGYLSSSSSNPFLRAATGSTVGPWSCAIATHSSIKPTISDNETYSVSIRSSGARL